MDLPPGGRKPVICRFKLTSDQDLGSALKKIDPAPDPGYLTVLTFLTKQLNYNFWFIFMLDLMTHLEIRKFL